MSYLPHKFNLFPGSLVLHVLGLNPSHNSCTVSFMHSWDPPCPCLTWPENKWIIKIQMVLIIWNTCHIDKRRWRVPKGKEWVETRKGSSFLTFLKQLFMYICNSYLNCPLSWIMCYKFHKYITFLWYMEIWPMRLAGLQSIHTAYI